MWLLNTTTYQLQGFVSEQAPPYAILSHCWREGEVSFADIQDLNVARAKHGWAKVEKACWFALEVYACAWVWIDTCCIDKSSSAELSEAINSMFAWYRDAEHCFAYLDDVRASEDLRSFGLAFRSSRWFIRGWTLQELLAPSADMAFVSEDWTPIGTREQFAALLEQITGVDQEILKSPISAITLQSASVAKRMSWAAGRETTRAEDRAYSLMGIFDVSMPTTYGEGGARAFHRLQLEIIRQTNDQSLFAWGPRMQPLPWRGEQLSFSQYWMPKWHKGALLAPSPDDFLEASDLVAGPLDALTRDLSVGPILEPHYFDTNYGIRMRVPLCAACSVGDSRLYLAALACRTEAERRGNWMGLLLSREAETDVYFCVGDFEIRDARGGHAWQVRRVVNVSGDVVPVRLAFPLPPTRAEVLKRLPLRTRLFGKIDKTQKPPQPQEAPQPRYSGTTSAGWRWVTSTIYIRSRISG